jgi:hypothetical protein
MPERSTDFHADGVTHFLVSPFSDQQFLQAVQFAQRHASASAAATLAGRAEDAKQDRSATWRWQPALSVELSPRCPQGGSARDGQRISLMELFRKLDPDGRRAAGGAIEG